MRFRHGNRDRRAWFARAVPLPVTTPDGLALCWRRCSEHWAGRMRALAGNPGVARITLALDYSPDPFLFRRLADLLEREADAPPGTFPRPTGTKTGRRKRSSGPGTTDTGIPNR